MKIMKQFLTYFTFLFSVLFLQQAYANDINNEDPNDVLQKVYKKLISQKTIHYDYYRELNYKSEDILSKNNYTVYFEHINYNKLLGFKYQIEDETLKQVYNGSENFMLNKENNTSTIIYKPVLKDFSQMSVFVNSIVTLKNSIPTIINDKKIIKYLSDSTIENKNYFVVKLILINKTLKYLSGFDYPTTKMNFTYQIFIDKETFYPSQIIQTNDRTPNDFVLTTFKNINTDDLKPTEASWYYSTYSKQYKQATKKKKISLIKANKIAPNFTLPYAESNEKLTRINLKGNVVLLDFWIKNCGICISSVPKINALINKYEKRNLKTIGINVLDNSVNIEQFYSNNKPLFKTVLGNTKVKEAYGIDGFPAFVIIDKAGIVMYAGEFDEKKIENILEKCLKEK
jgi:thiol-disulfide isomerase/thioredoxin